ncbi:MAG: low temperature requirement protein [Rhodoglobus sp.]|nr:low temperature requirement protein [Rhodoglobus sp.]
MKPIHQRMVARSITEPHRSASPLELLFDLTFVVAIAQLVVELAHAIVAGHAGEVVGPFLAVFFAIWWAWNQFTWLASAYDTDDVLYRVLTMVQMGGVLVLAAGVPPAFTGENFGAITLGYFIMRIGLVSLMIRAAREDPATSGTAWRYVIGITVVQAGWLVRLLLPPETFWYAFVLLAASELVVAPWADRKGGLAWHPHHIAERYGLFTIILLGESVLAVTMAVQASLGDEGVSAPLVIVAVAGLVLLFALWWLYFSQPAGEGLEKRRSHSYIWGYGHYLIFAALAAIGAGLEVAVEAVSHHVESSDTIVAWALALPLAVFLLLIWLLHAPIVDRVSIPPTATVAAVALVLLSPLTVGVIGVIGATLFSTGVTVALLVIALGVGAHRHRLASAST